MSRGSRIFVAEALGTMILILGGPGAVIFGSVLGLPVGPWGSPSLSASACSVPRT